MNSKAAISSHMMKGNSAQSVSSSSSVGSSKVSMNSILTKGDSSQIYLKTRGHAQSNMQVGMGTKSQMMVRKTPSGNSNSSSKNKKIKVAGPGSGLV